MMDDAEWNSALPDGANFDLEARMSVRAVNAVLWEAECARPRVKPSDGVYVIDLDAPVKKREPSTVTVGEVRDLIASIGGRKGVLKWRNIGKLTADEIMGIMPTSQAEPTARELELEQAIREMMEALRLRRVDVTKYARILHRR